MKTELRTRQVQETYNVYIADDGTEFTSKRDCELYELKQEINKHKLKSISVSDFDGYAATLWYINNQEEWKWLRKVAWVGSNIYGVFDGPGWYIASSHDGGDGPNWYDVYLLESYIKEYQDQIDEFKHLTGL